jgi:hypothetical protein
MISDAKRIAIITGTLRSGNMTIEEAVKVLEQHHMWTGEPQEIIDVKVENSAMGVAINTMSKYQKIEKIYQQWNKVNDFLYNQAMREIGEVIEDGSKSRKVSMGKQIDADKLIEHFIDKTPNGWLVPICENESRWTLEGIISEIKHFNPTIEAIPKADYEARLKADMVAMLEEIDLEMSEQSFGIQTEPWEVVEKLRKKIIQQKIDKLKETD